MPMDKQILRIQPCRATRTPTCSLLLLPPAMEACHQVSGWNSDLWKIFQAKLKSLIIVLAFETPRRSQTYGRRPEELHIPQSTSMHQPGAREAPRHHSYNTSQDFSPGQAPGITVQHSTPQASHYASPASGAPLPGALQPGRPGAPSANTAPSAVPTLPQLQMSNQQSSSRPTTANHAHSYSRSSPTGMDSSKYSPYITTPETSKFTSPTNNRYTGSHSVQGDASFSPLGLADIRPLNDIDGPQSANPYSNDGLPAFPTNSSYFAPYPVYAFDWCKWPLQQQSSGDSAGKMALGSYVEDGHNFVSPER